MKPLCGLCGDRHESHQAHRFATNAAATNRNATNATPKIAATNKAGKFEVTQAGTKADHATSIPAVFPKLGGDASGVEAVGAFAGDAGIRAGGESADAKTKNRRSKEAYNTYQREYMRKRRSAAK